MNFLNEHVCRIFIHMMLMISFYPSIKCRDKFYLIETEDDFEEKQSGGKKVGYNYCKYCKFIILYWFPCKKHGPRGHSKINFKGLQMYQPVLYYAPPWRKRVAKLF